jgi:hypothetical protein
MIEGLTFAGLYDTGAQLKHRCNRPWGAEFEAVAKRAIQFFATRKQGPQARRYNAKLLARRA